MVTLTSGSEGVGCSPRQNSAATNETTIMSKAKDLTKEAPTSPRVRTGGYATLARMADKGRAEIAGTDGDYNFDCPLDKHLFEFTGVTGEDVRKQLEAGASDEELAKWIDANGSKKTDAEKAAWSAEAEASNPYHNPDKKEWFTGACKAVGLDPTSSTLFDLLEADDKASFA